MSQRRWLAAPMACVLAVVFAVWPAMAAEVRTDDDVFEVPSAQGTGRDNEAAMREAKAQAILKAVGKFVHTDEERAAFEQVSKQFLYETQATYVLETELLDKYRQAQMVGVEISAKVNAKAIYQALLGLNVIQSVEKLAEALGFPKILVYVEQATAPDRETAWAIDRVNGFLQAHGCDVVLQEEAARLMQSDAELASAKGVGKTSMFFQQAGSDVFIKSKAHLENTRQSGDFVFSRATVVLEAVDCHSGRTIAQAEGQSRELALQGNLETSRKAAIEEAVANVSDELLTTMLKAWKSEVANGRDYMVVVSKGDSTSIRARLETMCAQVTSASEGRFTVQYKGTLRALYRELNKDLPIKRVKSNARELHIEQSPI